MAIFFVTGEHELDSLIEDEKRWTDRDNVLHVFDAPLEGLGKVLVERVRASVLSNSSKGQNARRGRRSLRKSIAASTESIKWKRGDATGTTVHVDPGKMGYDDRGLPKLYEGVEDWIHPVYGHEPVLKQSPDPYFGVVTRTAERDASRVGEFGIDKIADNLEGH